MWLLLPALKLYWLSGRGFCFKCVSKTCVRSCLLKAGERFILSCHTTIFFTLVDVKYSRKLAIPRSSTKFYGISFRPNFRDIETIRASKSNYLYRKPFGVSVFNDLLYLHNIFFIFQYFKSNFLFCFGYIHLGQSFW